MFSGGQTAYEPRWKRSPGPVDGGGGEDGMGDENTGWRVFFNSEVGGIRDTELLNFQRERERAQCSG